MHRNEYHSHIEWNDGNSEGNQRRRKRYRYCTQLYQGRTRDLLVTWAQERDWPFKSDLDYGILCRYVHVTGGPRKSTPPGLGKLDSSRESTSWGWATANGRRYRRRVYQPAKGKEGAVLKPTKVRWPSTSNLVAARKPGTQTQSHNWWSSDLDQTWLVLLHVQGVNCVKEWLRWSGTFGQSVPISNEYIE